MDGIKDIMLNFLFLYFIYLHLLLVDRYGKVGEASGKARSLMDEAKDTEMALLKNDQEEADKEKKIELDNF